MQKPNLNVIIFDDDQQPVHTHDIQKYTSTNKNAKTSSTNGHNSQKNLQKSYQNDKMSILSNEISELQTKIKSLQREGEKIRLQVQKRNRSNLGSIVPAGSNSKYLRQIEQILMIVEKKIQLIIQESRKLITKMTETVHKRISLLQKQQPTQKLKGEPINSKDNNKLNQIQLTLRHKIEEYENYYRDQYEKLVKESKRKQEIMMKKLSEIQLKFFNKLNAFETKEKQYVDWIHHLEAKLKERKSKKMITITQQKPQISPIFNKNNLNTGQTNQTQNNLENVPASNFQSSKNNCSIDQNSSKVIRKHKIFGAKQTSPAPRNNYMISPTKDSVVPKQGPNKVPNQPTSLYQQNPRGGENLNFYSELRNQQEEKIRQKSQRQSSQQGGWDKFADLNEFSGEFTQSESDDFFAPIDAPEVNENYERVLANIPMQSRGGTYHRETVPVQSYESQYKYQCAEDKVFSPFDLN